MGGANLLRRRQGVENHYVCKYCAYVQFLVDLLFEIKGAEGNPLGVMKSRKRVWLQNGGCAYFCGDSLEVATPECPNPKLVALYDKTSDLMVALVSNYAKVPFYKRNCELVTGMRDLDRGEITMRSSHESYSLFFPKAFEKWLRKGALDSVLKEFILLRSLVDGAGSYTYLKDYPHSRPMDFFISCRKFLEATMRHRVWFKIKEGGLRSPRLHVNCGELLKNPWSRFLSNAFASYFLSYVESSGVNLEKEVKPIGIDFEDEASIRSFFTSTSDWKVRLKDGREEDAVSLLESEYFSKVEALDRRVDADGVAKEDEDAYRLFLKKMDYVLAKLREGSLEKVEDYLQWVEMYTLGERMEFCSEKEGERVKQSLRELVSREDREWERIANEDSAVLFAALTRVGVPYERGFKTLKKYFADIQAVYVDEYSWLERSHREKLFSLEEVYRSAFVSPGGRAEERVKLLHELLPYQTVVESCKGEVGRGEVAVDWNSVKVKVLFPQEVVPPERIVERFGSLEGLPEDGPISVEVKLPDQIPLSERERKSRVTVTVALDDLEGNGVDFDVLRKVMERLRESCSEEDAGGGI